MRLCVWICVAAVLLGEPRVVGAEPGPDPEHELVVARRRRIKLALTVGAVGAGVLATGALFGLSARSQWHRAVEACDGAPEACPQAGLADAAYLRTLADRAATKANVLFAIGGLAVAAAVALYVTAPSDHRAVVVAPAIDRGAVGLVVTGALP
jgi:hypothetical protein